MRYAMLQCWDDGNKGDLGIMIATVTEIKKQDPEAVINAVSCYNAMDPKFKTAHRILKNYVEDVYPAIYGVLGINAGGKYKKGNVSKLIALLIEEARYQMMMLLPQWLSVFFFTSDEKKTLKMLKNSDIIFQKGGSGYTDYSSRRGYIALRRLCRSLLALTKQGMEYFVLGQSFGPIETKAGVKIVNQVIRAAKRVYIREQECVRKFSELDLHRENVRFSNDAGFLIYPKKPRLDQYDSKRINIGITLRNMEETTPNYKEIMLRFIIYLKKKYDAVVHIFQQVNIEKEIDIIMAETILQEMPSDYRSCVVYHIEELLPQELCWWYGQMDAFVATRLHSAIFAMTVGTPAIVLAYQGTKAQGIFGNLGIGDLVVEGPLTYKKMTQSFDEMWDNRENITSRINRGVSLAQYQMRKMIEQMISIGRNGNELCE